MQQKINKEIDTLREHEPPEGYFFADSGGKDSTVARDLLIKAGVKYDGHYNSTTIDPPEILRFIKLEHPETNWHYPIYKGKPTNFYQLLILKGLPIRQQRWCCEVLKEKGGMGRLMIDGVRAAESHKRAKRVKFEYFMNKYFHKKYKDQDVPQKVLDKLLEKGRAKKIIHIIFDWSDKDVWDYIKMNNLPYCELYDQGWKRVGCIGCPMASEKQRTKEYDCYPIIKRNIIKAIRYAKDHNGKLERFESAEQVFDWWISGLSIDKFFGRKEQMRIDI